TAIRALGERQRDLAERLDGRQAALSVARQGLEKAQQQKTAAARTVETLRTTEGQIQALAGNLAKARSRVEQARQDLKTAERAAADAADRALRLAAGDLAAADQAVASLKAGLAEAEGDVDRLGKEIRELLPTEQRQDPDWPAHLRARVERAARQLENAERSIADAQGTVTATSNEVAGIAAELQTIPRQLEERRQVLLGLHARCRQVETALRKVLGDLPGPDAGARLAAIDEELHAAETELEQAAAAVQKAQQALHEAR